MKVYELLKLELIEELENGKFKCNNCGKIYTKLGIPNHHFYNHEDVGIQKKKEMRKQAIEKNNTPEMKKKISEGTLAAYKKDEVRQNHLKGIKTEDYLKRKSQKQKELWQDDEYKERVSRKIKESHASPEFRQNLSDKIKKIHNNPNSTIKSEAHKEKCKARALDQWQDNEFIEKQHQARLKAWKDPDRKNRQSKMLTKVWKDPNHIEKVLKGKIAYLRKTGKNPSLGKYGTTENDVIYESTFERDIFEYLEKNNIPYAPHINLPGSSKICDLIVNETWVELDGLNREQFDKDSEFSWNGKIELYEYLKETGLIQNFKIFKSVDEFINWIDPDNYVTDLN